MVELKISAEMLKVWAAEKRSDMEEIARLRKLVDGLNDRIRAFLTLAGDTLDDHTVAWATAVASATTISELDAAEKGTAELGVTLISAIEMVLSNAERPLSPAEIRAGLAGVGYQEPINSSSGYFYTALSRLVERGTAKRLPDKTIVLSSWQETSSLAPKIVTMDR